MSVPILSTTRIPTTGKASGQTLFPLTVPFRLLLIVRLFVKAVHRFVPCIVETLVRQMVINMVTVWIAAASRTCAMSISRSRSRISVLATVRRIRDARDTRVGSLFPAVRSMPILISIRSTVAGLEAAALVPGILAQTGRQGKPWVRRAISTLGVLHAMGLLARRMDGFSSCTPLLRVSKPAQPGIALLGRFVVPFVAELASAGGDFAPDTSGAMRDLAITSAGGEERGKEGAE